MKKGQIRHRTAKILSSIKCNKHSADLKCTLYVKLCIAISIRIGTFFNIMAILISVKPASMIRFTPQSC